ncbi:MAG: hypothetical protein ABFR33_07785 [Verrucomicrobiota bacterium]
MKRASRNGFGRIFLAAAIMGGLAVRSGAQLISNGSFENEVVGTSVVISTNDTLVDLSTFSDWRVFSVGGPPSTGLSATTVTDASDGNQALRLDATRLDLTDFGTGVDHGLDRDGSRIPVINTNFTFSFDAAWISGSTNFLAILAEHGANGAYLGHAAWYYCTVSNSDYQTFSFEWTPAGGNATHSVNPSFRQMPTDAETSSSLLLDNVRLTPPDGVSITPAAIAAKSARGDPTDIFQTIAKPDISFDSGLHPAGYHIEDLFSAYDPVGWNEDVVFSDTNGTNVSSVCFSTPDPVHLTQLVVGLANDGVAGPDNDRRTCSSIRLYASLCPCLLMNEPVADIAVDPEYTDAYGGSQITVDIPLDVDARYFYIEFLEPRDHGVRVFEIDGYGDVLYSDPTLPPTIVGCSTVSSNMLEMVVDAPGPANRYHLQGTASLLPESRLWRRVAHSDGGGGPFAYTNLAYSTPDTATDTNEVAHVRTDDAAGFFRIVGDGERSATIARELEDYFDQVNPPYGSLERKNALYRVDALVNHHPFPYDDWLKGFFLNRYLKTIDGIETTDVQTGAVAWNLYNMAYVVKTKGITVAFDLIRVPHALRGTLDDELYDKLATKIVDLCDVLFISHAHDDHADGFVADEFIRRGKQVVAPSNIFMQADFYDDILHLPPDGAKTNLWVPGRGVELSLRIYPGHQQISATGAIENNFTVATLPNGITVAHSGDQYWAPDFVWIDTVYTDVAVDILMANNWTLWPDRLRNGVRPAIILPGHVNEMGHGIPSRIPFWKSYLSWQNAGDEAVHLLWGEPYGYGGSAKIIGE